MKSKVLQRKMFRDPSEDENVGIMQGFMDSLGDMLSGEGDMSEDDDDDSPSGAPDRTPGSPEILMNTLRGDMRSVDARVEELADMVGYNAASSTPLEVLALLQPVLKQQGIAALQTSSAMPTSTAMSPSPAMAPAPSTPVPPVPAQGGGIATLPQGDMGQGPPPMPMQMARGGVVQNFEEGGGVNAENVTPADTGTFSPEMMAFFNKRLLSLQEDADTVPSQLAPGYLMQRTQELAPQYRTLIGADPNASKGQMLFDVAQAALNYAGNVNAQGQPMRGSQAARLAGAVSGLPAAIGARAAEAQKQNQGIRLAAMQGAQSEIDAVRAANTSRQATLDKIAIEAMKQKQPPRPMTAQDKAAYGITGADADLAWVFDSTGKPMIAGGRPPAPLVNIGERTLEQVVMEGTVAPILEQYNSALSARSNIAKLDDTIGLINESSADVGFGAELRQNIRRIQGLFSVDPERIKALSDTELLNAAVGQDVFGAINTLGIGARGIDTPAERDFLRDVLAGRITLNKDTLLRMADMRRRAEERSIESWNNTLASGRIQPILEASQGMIINEQIAFPRSPVDRSAVNTDTPKPTAADYEAELAARAAARVGQ